MTHDGLPFDPSSPHDRAVFFSSSSLNDFRAGGLDAAAIECSSFMRDVRQYLREPDACWLEHAGFLHCAGLRHRLLPLAADVSEALYLVELPPALADCTLSWRAGLETLMHLTDSTPLRVAVHPRYGKVLLAHVDGNSDTPARVARMVSHTCIIVKALLRREGQAAAAL